MTRKETNAEWAQMKKEGRVTVHIEEGKGPKPVVILDRRRFGELLRRTFNGGFNDGANWMEKRLKR